MTPPPILFPLFLLRRYLDLTVFSTLIGHARLAQTMGKTIGTAFGANGETGALQLPHGTTTLIPALLGDFTLGDCHIDTSLGECPVGTFLR